MFVKEIFKSPNPIIYHSFYIDYNKCVCTYKIVCKRNIEINKRSNMKMQIHYLQNLKCIKRCSVEDYIATCKRGGKIPTVMYYDRVKKPGTFVSLGHKSDSIKLEKKMLCLS